MEREELLEKAESEIEELTQLMGVDAEMSCEVIDGDDGQLILKVRYEGDDLGYMIGNRGAHLRSLQFVLSLYLNRKLMADEESNLIVNVDVSGYKAEREEKIEQLALRMADDARILGEPIEMEPMPAAERRVVHMVLQQFEDIKTESFGDGEYRYVKIIPNAEAKDLELSERED